ncbi:MAG: MBOAT family O-acyltransferase [Lentimicrobium sp.]|jgi:D-alanyl-lipoteichoic acid acyltransferase DltB (MBOAT superfamily)|nr:MBOAT family O-acyltransferase [Lentimicrobium sp.]
MNRLKEIFAFSEAFPLIFTQASFWIFFAIVYLGFALVYSRKNVRNAYLLLVSLFFYYKTSGVFVGLLVFTTLSNYGIGWWIFKSKAKSLKLALLSLSVALNLLILGYFKYAYFITDSINYIFNAGFEVNHWLAEWGNSLSRSTYFTVDKIILPVGISFFTFQTITYCVDIYRDKLKPVNSVIDFGFFVTFFPQLVAGPIVRAGEFIPQTRRETRISRAEFNMGTLMILKGLIKKMIFADYIAMHFLDKVFDAPSMFSGFTNIMAMIGYSLQIYGDFSGYTDIAIGLALLMGFRLPENFNSPYKALNCGDFWKRWHISLSSFLKDYLYIPLGGNRKGSVTSFVFTAIIIGGMLIAFGNLTIALIVGGLVVVSSMLAYFIPSVNRNIVTNINIMLTMLIGGLWHGASWKFVIWGGLNGLGIVFYKYWRQISPWEKVNNRLSVIWKIALTFAFITFTRIYFRGVSMEHIAQWYRQVAGNMDWANALNVLMAYRLVFVVMLLGYISHWLPYRTKAQIADLYGRSHISVKVIAAVLTGVLCYQAYSASFQPFIYFQF